MGPSYEWPILPPSFQTTRHFSLTHARSRATGCFPLFAAFESAPHLLQDISSPSGAANRPGLSPTATSPLSLAQRFGPPRLHLGFCTIWSHRVLMARWRTHSREHQAVARCSVKTRPLRDSVCIQILRKARQAPWSVA